MKQIILVVFFLTIFGCKEKTKVPQENSQTQTELQKKLKKTDLPIEVIQADVSFLSNPIFANNSVHLRYELNISNNYRIPFTLKKVEIYDLQKDEVPIALFDTKYIEEHFDRPGNNDLDDLKLLSGNEFGILNLNLIFKKEQSFPEKIFHKLYFERTKSNGEIAMHPMEVAVIKIPETNKFSIGLPFKTKGKWLYEAESHQGARFLTEGRVNYPQRFAIDWTLITPSGNFAYNDTKENENWETYGIEIISVADGKIVGVKDEIIENEPLSRDMAVRITRETIGGNYVIIDIGSGRYAFYGHLVPNSLKVKIGDTVKKGQVIGLLGNSGNSDAPHLHFHLETKSNTFFGGEGIPFHIDRFTQLNNYSEQQVMDLFNNNSVSLDSLNPVKKTNELPIGFGLIEVE
ncbi:Peptidase family M23 [Marivirga sericea]|uniref:Peptidase family M23 n=1 Tax=Marivirga sericea TaxID=1028 RepID=A0A1X7K5Z3_9BACT|nr:M23 family metallopeptidase [Marivirga sericea]SMG36072.1 Peptidase family M23 [Marivirga sericea]